MRFSDAIALGRTMIQPCPLAVFGDRNNGCAQGMAIAAVGGYDRWTAGYTSRDFWPWTIKHEEIPCACQSRGGYGENTLGVVAHLFDKHVFGDKTWTLDQLIDWVRSIEPPEPEEALAVSTQPDRALEHVRCGDGISGKILGVNPNPV